MTMRQFTSADQRAYMSPSSSPASSPDPFDFHDSSPPSSPSLEPISLDDPPYSGSPSGAVVHPYAGTARATRPPPRYEMKHTSPYSTPPNTPPSIDFRSPRKRPGSPTPTQRNLKRMFDEAEYVFETKEDRQAKLWQKTITDAVDSATLKIDLSNKGLTYIPAEICDLANVVVLPPLKEVPVPIQIPAARTFSRSQTAPAAVLSSAYSFRSKSVERPHSGIELYLGPNEIRTLPLELFQLRNLVVLVLRNNALTHIPPQIAELRGLRSLNVALNKLQYLPAEMTTMRLKECYVTPNPFLTPPEPPAPTTQTTPSATTQTTSATTQPVPSVIPPPPTVTPPTRHFGRVPPLTELALRTLLSPAPPDPAHPLAPPQTTLQAHFVLPLPADAVPAPVRAALARAVPGCVAAPDLNPTIRTLQRAESAASWASGVTLVPFGHEADAEEGGEGGVGRCPHGGAGEGWARTGPVYVQHAEERLAWASCVAGVDVGCLVPLLWRGCTVGCLDFLEGGVEVQEEREGEGAEEEWAVPEVKLGAVLEDEDWEMGEA